MFKKLFISPAGGLLLVVLTMAGINQTAKAETLPLFGARLAVAEANFSGLASSTTLGYGLVLGVTLPTYRVYADLNFYSWDEADTRTIHANYDYLWRADESWQVFTGVYGGLVDLGLNTTRKYQSGPSAGIQAGFLLPLGASGWQLETGLRYGGFSAKAFDSTKGYEVKIKSQFEGFISFNFSS